jgi:hypothetical protein
MTAPSDPYDIGEDGQCRAPALEAIDRDLERLGELTGPHVINMTEDLSVAAARIPDDDQRREAEELLGRLRPVIGPHLDTLGEARPAPDGQHPA